ncbi:MAG: TIGR02449 family protein [Pseudomonadales bacterium]|jgi:cell division protein ZapB
MSDASLKTLEAKIDELIAFAAHLQQENEGLRERESNLLKERSHLIEKNQVVRQRVEAIVKRLKSMQDT